VAGHFWKLAHGVLGWGTTLRELKVPSGSASLKKYIILSIQTAAYHVIVVPWALWDPRGPGAPWNNNNDRNNYMDQWSMSLIGFILEVGLSPLLLFHGPFGIQGAQGPHGAHVAHGAHRAHGTTMVTGTIIWAHGVCHRLVLYWR